MSETERWIGTRQSAYEGAGFVWYGLWLPSGAVVGTCGILLSERCAPEPEIGYEIATTHRRNGYAKEAASVVTHAANDFGVPRLWATVRTRNKASIKVVTSLGFARDRAEADEHGEMDFYFCDLGDSDTHVGMDVLLEGSRREEVHPFRS